MGWPLSLGTKFTISPTALSDLTPRSGQRSHAWHSWRAGDSLMGARPATQIQGVMNKGKDKGMKKDIRGYWIDIVNSPYVSFGVDCERVSTLRAYLLRAGVGPYSSGSALLHHPLWGMCRLRTSPKVCLKSKTRELGRSSIGMYAIPLAACGLSLRSYGSVCMDYIHLSQHTVEVAVFNMLSYFWEIETGSPYTMAKVRARLRRMQSTFT